MGDGVLDFSNVKDAEGNEIQEDNRTEDQKAEHNAAAVDKLFAGKYKDVGGLEEGYKNLSTELRELSSKIPKAPESYAFDFSEDLVLKDTQVDVDSPALKGVLDTMKINNVPQKAATEILRSHFLSMQQLRDHELKEIKSSVPAEVLGNLNTFGRKLGTEDQEVFESLCDTAQGIDFISRHFIPRANTIPTGAQSTSPKSAVEYEQEAFALQGSNDLGANPELAERYYALLEKAAKRRRESSN